jgi:integrase
MPAETRGSVYRVKAGWGIRWTADGKRHHQSPFPTKTAARQWFNEHVAPKLRRGGPSPDITFHAFTAIYLDRWGRTVTRRTRDTIHERLQHKRTLHRGERCQCAVCVFGDWTLHELEGAADDIAAWRANLTSTSRYRLTLALRQVLAAAVRWGYITRNPAVDAGANPEPRSDELRPFTRHEVNALAAELGPVYGPLVVFAAETGLRTNEWAAVERKDIVRGDRPAVVVQRRYSDGVLTPFPKTVRRRVPLTPRAITAVEAVPARLDTMLLFPASEGGHVNLDNWRTREWYPALEAAGVERRGVYSLRHSFASEALAAGVSIFELSRLMGASVRTIDRTYAHFAHDSEDHLRDLLTARSDSTNEETG